tara:strand:+ start:5398 stop:6651 length:1254 start_codon:yes stop_codon:yes gene_type:complete
MDKFIVKGGKSLNGEVQISGAKNAALPIFAAALLASGKFTIRRVPKLRDTITMIRLLEIIGAEIEFKDSTLEIDTTKCHNPEAPYDLVKTMRASFYVLGPLVARFGRAKVSLPGGCAWGPRPVDFHITAMKQMGVQIDLEEGYILAKAEKLKGNKISFKFPSVGATGNVLMAAVLAEGKTTIHNAAREPEIICLCEFLNKMGAEIVGIGTHELTVDGVSALKPVEFEVIPDRVEAATFLIAGTLLSDELVIKGADRNHLETIFTKLEQAGCNLEVENDFIKINRVERLKPIDVTTAVYPGFPTDVQAQWLALMSLADGTSVITDTIYNDRFTHVAELNRLGAKISLNDNVATVDGVKSLKGAHVMSTDIRASASLVLAALAAEGVTEISRIYHIDRGYERIEEKFSSVGADISRIHK